jgi:hypothetical protein
MSEDERLTNFVLCTLSLKLLLRQSGDKKEIIMDELGIDELRMLCASMVNSLYTKEDFLTNGVTAEYILSHMKEKVITVDKDKEERILSVLREAIYTILVEMTDQTTKIIDA